MLRSYIFKPRPTSLSGYITDHLGSLVLRLSAAQGLAKLVPNPAPLRATVLHILAVTLLLCMSSSSGRSILITHSLKSGVEAEKHLKLAIQHPSRTRTWH